MTLLLAAVVFGACGSGDPAQGASGDAGLSAATSTAESATSTITASAEVTSTSTLGPSEHVAERTLAQIVHLAEVIGPRVAGTEAARIAAAYIADEFRRSGYAVETVEFPVESPALRISTVSLGAEALESLALTGSETGVVVGSAVFVGTADAASIKGLDLQGAIAVALRDQRRFDDKMTTVEAAGAAGLVIINRGSGFFNGTLGQEATIPVVTVGSEDGPALITAAENRAEIEINVPVTSPVVGRNVVAHWEQEGSCEVLVGGHYDTVAEDPGANDNSSGTAHVLELARAFAADGLDEGLCFAAFDAEELGLIGSGELAGDWQALGILPLYMVNLDVTGTGDNVEVIGSSGLVRRALDIASSIGVPAVASSLPPNTGSDHTSFADRGVEVVFFSSGGFPEIHTPRDIIELIQEDELGRVGDLAFATISSLLSEIASD